MKARLALGIFLVTSIVFFSAFLSEPDNWGVRDWGFQLYMHGTARESIVRYAQMPMWDPFRCGGNIMLAHPEAPIFSFPFLLFLLLNSTLAFKLSLIIYAALGMLGMWLLARQLGVRGWSSLLPPLIGVLNASIFLYAAEGNFWVRAQVWLPFLVYFFLRCEKSRKFCIPTALTLLIILLDTNIYAFAIALYFIGAWALIDAIVRHRTLFIKAAVLVILLTLLLGAFKIVPLAHFAFQFPEHRVDTESGYTWASLMTGLLNRDQGPYAPHRFSDKRAFFHHGAYIGWIALILGIAGMILSWRRYLRLTLVFLLTLWLSFGNNAFINIYRFIKFTPPFAAFHEATRFLPLALVFFGIFAGVALSRIERLKKIVMPTKSIVISHGLRAAVILGIIAFIAINMFLVNTASLDKVFIGPPVEPSRMMGSFEQIDLPYGSNPWPDGRLELIRDSFYHDVWGHGMYMNLLAGKGTPKGYCHGNVGMHAQARILENGSDNAAYRGEVYLLSGNGTATIAMFSPNRFEITVNAQKDDILILNQNYYDLWRATGGTGRIQSYEGLLAVPVGAQTTQVAFYYSKNLFMIGLLITILSSLGAILAWRKWGALAERLHWLLE